MDATNDQRSATPRQSGRVTAVRGSVVDVAFRAHMPAPRSLLELGEAGIRAEVQTHVDEHTVRSALARLEADFVRRFVRLREPLP